jgi:hypothetical protein
MKRSIAIFGGILLVGLFAGCYGVFYTHAQNGDATNPDPENIQWDSSSYTATSTLTATGNINGEVDYGWCWEDEEYQLGYQYVSYYQPIDPGTMVSIVGGEGEQVSVPVVVEQQAVEPTQGCTDMGEEQVNAPPAPTTGIQAYATYSYTQDTSAYPSGTYTLFATIDPEDCTLANYQSANFSYGRTWVSCQGDLADEASLTVSHAPETEEGNGVINVNSVNAATGVPLMSSWWLSGSSSSIYTTNQTSGVYQNLPTTSGATPIPYTVIADPNSVGPLYTLGKVQQGNIAEIKTQNSLTHLFTFIDNAFSSVALADDVCNPSNYSFDSSTGQYVCQGGDVNTQPLLPQYNNIANFVIGWDPMATVSANPSSTQLTDPNQLSQQIQVVNSGASSSVLDWKASTASAWLSLSVTSGTGVPSGGSDPLTLTANSPLPADGATAVVNLQGTSENCNSSLGSSGPGRGPCSSSASINVKFTASSNSCPTCTSSSTPPTVSVTANPDTITLGSSTQVTVVATGDPAPACTETDSWSGVSCSSTVEETPNATGTFVFGATATNASGTATSSAIVTVTSSGCTGPDCTTGGNPTVSVTADPSTITLGDSTQVTISSTGATNCTESGDWSGTQCNDTVTETPTAVGTSTYGATVTNANGSAQASTIVTVTSSGCTGTSCSTPPGNPTSTPPGNPTSTPPGGGVSSCALNATPASITPGQSSQLSYDCTDVSTCYISGGQFGSYTTVPVSGSTASGSTNVNPTTDTVYSLSCDSGVASATAQVTVSNPGLNETNP